ncbi:MAG: UvrD-helicase domain-containing protein [Bacteroidota bacterium]|nr:UvrD-helicase domain-containing protein [Bacteroidota bacterium]
MSQYEAVTSVNGPHLVIAGAGTGKTRIIVYRVTYLVNIDLFCYSISEVNFNLIQQP